MKSSAKLLIFTFLSTVPFLGFNSVFAQGTDIILSDSAIVIEPIDLADIPQESASLFQNTQRISDEMISESDLLQLKNETDSLLAIIESFLELNAPKDLIQEGARKLESDIIFWNQELSLLEDQMMIVSAILQNLDHDKFKLLEWVSVWTKTEQSLGEVESAESIDIRIKEVLHTIDTTLNSINTKSNTTLNILNGITAMGVDIESRRDEINQAILQKQQRMLKNNQPSFFGIDYSRKANWDLTGPVSTLYKVELRRLKSYIMINAGIVVFHLFLIILLIIIFIFVKRADIQVGDDESSVYKKRLKLLLSRPVSVALIIGLFASVILYPNSPLIFKDVFRLLVMIPIVLILLNTLPRKFHIYVFSMGVLVLLHIIYINLPARNIFSRFLLLFIAMIEIGALSHFIFYYKRKLYTQIYQAVRIILIFCYIFLLMGIVGFFGNISGNVNLAEFFLFSVSGNALVATLIVLSLIVINGLLVFFIETKFARKSNVLRKNNLLLIKKITRLFNIAAIVLIIYYVLKNFGWETVVIDEISDWLAKERKLGSIEFSWGKLFIFFLVIWFSILLSKIVRAILEDDVLSKMKLEKGLPNTISMMVRYTLVTLGVFLAVSAAGLPFGEFAIILGAFSVGIGFGLQNIFNNLVSGLILLFERPIKIGDTIEVGTLMGNVKSIGIRSSNVRTFDGAEIIVPNGNLISNEVINWTLSDQRRRIEVVVGVSYSSDPHEVHRILLKILQDHKDIINDPEPNVFFKDLGESSLDFRMLFWTHHFEEWIRIRSEIIFKVFDKLKEAGIEIPFPQRDLHVRSIEQEIEVKTKKDKS